MMLLMLTLGGLLGKAKDRGRRESPQQDRPHGCEEASLSKSS